MKNTTFEDSPFLRARGGRINLDEEIKRVTEKHKNEANKRKTKKKKDDGNPIRERDIDKEKGR